MSFLFMQRIIAADFIPFHRVTQCPDAPNDVTTTPRRRPYTGIV